MIKILILGTLVIGSLVLLTNILPVSRQNLRSRRSKGTGDGPLAFVSPAFKGLDDNAGGKNNPRTNDGKVRKTEEQWKAELTEEQFKVTRCSATERPFTGRYWNHREDGTYLCVGCGQELFSSEAKFDSGNGWPSYTRPVDSGAVDEIKDISYGMVRTEIVCSRCESHLGHVFPDGPRPTRLRYCINSAALDFLAEDGIAGPDTPESQAQIASGE